MHAANQNTNQETWITRCPECSTAFRLNKNHLQAAKGTVRCGSCLHIFKAMDFLVGENRPDTPSTHAQEPIPPRDNIQSSPKKSPNIPVDSEEHDETWALNMLKELELDQNPDTSKTSAARSEAPLSRENPADKPKQSLEKLNDAPLELHYRKKSRQHPVFWTFASVLALALLLGQYIQSNFQKIAFDQKLRPALITLCGYTGCQVPALSAPSLVKASQIIVRPDQEYQNTLAINAIITNTAQFSQPYPTLLVTANGSDGSPDAVRSITPNTYLSGQVAGARLMTPGQPVHISLRMISPTPDIRSVTLDFH